MDTQHLDSLLSAAGIARPDGERFDQNQTAFLARELEAVKRKTYEIKYPAFRAREFIPADPETVPPGAETISYDEWDEVGDAAIIGNMADDLPGVDVFKARITAGVHWIGARYHYSIQDLQRCAMTGVSLPAKKAAACRRAIEKRIDLIAAFGSVTGGLGGFTNLAGVVITPLAAPGAWAVKTAAQIQADFVAGLAYVWGTTNQMYSVDTVLLDPVAYMIIAQMQFSVASDKTVLAWLLENCAPLGLKTIQPWPYLTTAGAGGVTRAIFYARDPEVVCLNIPLEYTELPPQPKNLSFNINAYAKIAGVELHQLAGMTYMDGF
jgi:hypothetical protein